MPESVWVEVALNGPWTRQRQPGIPVTRAELVEEAVASADAGAAIVHLHAYDEGSGSPREAYDLYAPVFEAIRSHRDVICYPTVPMGARPSQGPDEARARYEVVERLGRAGLIEWSVVDPGSVTLATFDELRDGAGGFLCANSASDVGTGLALCDELGLVPGYAVYERLPADRRDLACRRPGPVGTGLPVHVLDGVRLRPAARRVGAGQLPATARHVRSGRTLDDRRARRGPERVMGVAMARGGHLRVGLEDAPLGCPKTNVELTAEACRAVEQAGLALASPTQIRRATVSGNSQRPAGASTTGVQ